MLMALSGICVIDSFLCFYAKEYFLLLISTNCSLNNYGLFFQAK